MYIVGVGESAASQIPHDRGQGLVSGLHRNSGTRGHCFGFTVRHITLGANSQDRGASDKSPVLAQHAEQGALLSTENVLPRHGVLAWNPTVQLERYMGEPSLSGEPECLSPCIVYHEQMSLYSGIPPHG